jgi:predicted transcriptional regulator
MNNRSRTDIAAHIIEAANGGATKTRLMYKVYLSHQQLKEYLAILEENGLLTFDQTSATFRTTPKGHQFIDTYNKLNELSGLAMIGSIQGRRLSALL